MKCLVIFLMLLWKEEMASKIDKLDHEIYLYSKYFFKRLTHMIWATPAVNICKTKQTAVEQKPFRFGQILNLIKFVQFFSTHYLLDGLIWENIGIS